MINTTIIGYLGTDPESKTTQSGKQATTFSIGSQRKDAKGEKTTDWIDCVAYGKTGEIVLSYCHKGDRMGIVGELQTRSWQDKATGQNRKMYIVLVDKVEFISSKKTEESGTVPFEV